MKKINYAIIGCGNIAGNYKIKSNFKGCFTHADAMSKVYNPFVCIDKNIKKAITFKKKFHFNFYSQSVDFLKKNYAEVIIIASDTNSHFKLIQRICLFKKKPKLIICEKPFTEKFSQALKSSKLLKSKNIRLIVNYTRRWDKNCNNIIRKIKNKEFGDFKAGYCVYNKGIMNTASHFIDIFLDMFGDLDHHKIPGKKIYDNTLKDPTIPFVLITKRKVPIYFGCTNNHDKSNHEIKLFFSKKIIETTDAGIHWKIMPNIEKTILKFTKKQNIKIFDTTIGFAFLNLVKFLNQIMQNLQIKKLSNLNERDLKIHKIINNIIS